MFHKIHMKNISSLRVVDKLVSQSREWRCGDTVQIVLSQTQRYYPNYTTLFVCVLDYLKKIKKVQIVLAGVNSYGRRIGINEPFNVNNLQQHMKVTDRVIEFHDQDEAYKITQKYIDVLLESVVCKEGVIDTFEWCIYEILDNVFEHSRAEKGFVMMQLLPQQHRCLIAVADAGRGIHKAMYEGSKESQLDAERIWRADHAIEYSLERGVTSKGKNNQGNGLFGLRSAVEINGGLFKSRNTPTPHQLDNGPTSGKNKRIKSLQITSSHTGRTVAPPAYNRAHTSAIHHATDSPHLSYHLGKTRRKATSTNPGPGS